MPAKNTDGTDSSARLAWMLRWDDGGSDWPEMGVRFQDTVSAVTIAKSGQWYLNFGEPYPHQTLSVWVPKSYTRKTKQAWFLGLKGKTVRVEGRASSYKGTPEVVVNKLDQIQIVGD